MTKEFTFDEAIYKTNEQGNYFYKSTGKTDKQGNPMFMRISQKVFDKAWEESGEAEKAKQAAIQAKKDAETEKNFNKKASKSKDVAFIFTPNGDENHQITLTTKQVAFLKLLPTDNFWGNGLDSTLWIDCLCDTIADQFNPMAVGAMVSTLREKHLITVTVDRVNGKKCKYMAFTELGQVVAKELGLA